DSGVGMTAKQIEDIGSIRVKSTKGTGNESGTGLGLLLCKDFVQRQGGTMEVQSELNKGTVFKIIFPNL
ncbi:MAG: ATP-binding protein, partial [Cyclobacteriaceae bacterium]|nr:ATP-binding protein [Cyclobacteriaceae bacterium]